MGQFEEGKYLDWQCILDEDRKSFSKKSLPSSIILKQKMKSYDFSEIQKNVSITR